MVCSSNTSLKFSKTEDGTHAGGTEYTEGVTIDVSNNKTIINVKPGTPDLYYYCGSHSVGAGIETLSFQNLKTVEYMISFNNDLVDGEYLIKLIDDAENELAGSEIISLKLKLLYQL